MYPGWQVFAPCFQKCHVVLYFKAENLERVYYHLRIKLKFSQFPYLDLQFFPLCLGWREGILLLSDFCCPLPTVSVLKSFTFCCKGKPVDTSKKKTGESLGIGLATASLGLLLKMIQKRQPEQNAAVQLLKGASGCPSVTPILYHLHWLPVFLKFQAQFSLLALTS